MTIFKRIIRPLGVLLLAGLVMGSECGLLKVENPGQLPESALEGPGAINTLVNGAYGDLSDAYDNLVILSGVFTDELAHSGSFPNWRRIDTRTIDPNDTAGSGLLGMWQDLQTARVSAELAVPRVREAAGAGAGTSAVLAEVLMLAGFANLLIADNFCQGVIDGGPAVPSAEMYTRAEGHFSEAITIAAAAGAANGLSASAANIRNAALVGRARARLALGNTAGAAADADLVPAAFVYNMLYAETSGRENNEIAVFTVFRREASIGQPFWNNPAIPQCSSNPNRNPAIVPTCTFPTEGQFGPDNQTPLFVQLLYASRASAIPLARGVDAQFIGREARGENVAAEKAVATFLRAQRLPDMRRRNDPFLAGGDACFPVPQREIDSNPNL
jgi:hypothetical protein